MLKSNRQQNSGAKAVMSFLVFLLVIAGVAGVFANNWYRDQIYTQRGVEDEVIVIAVEDGKGLLDIAPELEEKGLIGNTTALKIYLRLEKPTINIIAGNYNIPGKNNLPELIELLNKGPKLASVKVTIQEGVRYDEVADKIAKAFESQPDAKFKKSEYLDIVENPGNHTFNTSVAEFLNATKPSGKNLEGFLFPDTYTIGTDATALQVVELQISTLQRRLQENNLDYTTGGIFDQFYQALTLASILEREAGRKEQDQKIIAHIFFKRIAEGGALYADSTYLYFLKDWDYSLTNTELNSNRSNLYNTYIYPGLTPTPISNPGISTLRAVFDPEENDYYYFITGTDGVNRYARTLPEHQSNINRYL